MEELIRELRLLALNYDFTVEDHLEFSTLIKNFIKEAEDNYLEDYLKRIQDVKNLTEEDIYFLDKRSKVYYNTCPEVYYNNLRNSAANFNKEDENKCINIVNAMNREVEKKVLLDVFNNYF